VGVDIQRKCAEEKYEDKGGKSVLPQFQHAGIMAQKEVLLRGFMIYIDVHCKITA
jgi:hypothetical protein